MQDVVSISPTAGQRGGRRVLPRLLSYLPRGNSLDDRAWHRRHRLLEREADQQRDVQEQHALEQPVAPVPRTAVERFAARQVGHEPV